MYNIVLVNCMVFQMMMHTAVWMMRAKKAAVFPIITIRPGVSRPTL